jgi:two-component system nitrogen regulation response regulator GlnG
MHTIVRPKLHSFGRAPASLSATTTAHTAVPGRSIFRVIDDRASRHVTPKLLIIDKDMALMPEWLRQAFPAPAFRVQVAATGAEGLRQVRIDSPDVILLDPGVPDQSGLGVYEEIRRIDAHIPVIFVTMTNRADGAIEAMRAGAHDYLFKPLDPHELQRVVGDALEVARRMREPANPEAAGTPFDPDLDGPIVGTCPAMREVYKAIGRVAAQDVPVLITGESGTGKEVVAHALYQHGTRSEAPFLALNCAAIPENLLESELFGHEKGAFTGADRRRIGKFEQCHGGTLFLDEIGDMPPALQAKILRVLQEQTFERVGGNETIKTNVRIIAATHRDLKAWSGDGRFRPDLYYRLGVFTIHLPPLRERGDDLPLLVRHFLRRFSRELCREVGEAAPDALERLRGYTWPGNIRELQSVLKQALLKARGTTLLPAHLPALAGETGGSVPASPSAGDDTGLEAFLRQCLTAGDDDQYAQAHRRLDRLFLARVLEATDGNQHNAARRLGIARHTLRRKLRELGIHLSRRSQIEENEPSLPSLKK